MLDSSLVESRRDRLSKRRIILLPIVIGIHVLALVVAVASSVWSVSYIEEAPIQVSIFVGPPPPPPAAKPKPKKPKAEAPKPKAPPSTANLAPLVIPSYDPEPIQTEKVDVSDLDADVGSGFDYGVEGGIPGGVPGGVPTDKPIWSEHSGGQPPTIKSRVPCVYPELARRSQIEGTVVLEAVIGTEGKLEEVKLVKPAHPLLDKSAEDCVRKWSFEPAIVNGRKIKAFFNATVNYKFTTH
ncbi:MAG: energy transducer TonB [Candidatus Schekmanbacteria bacterium]|nr:energy transducer TonB [Candidatus Schekmanbacteria bacterium]